MTQTLTPAVLDVIDRLREARVVPTVRAPDAEAADGLARELVAGGLTTFEFTATTPGWQALLATWTRDHPEATVGLGTVTSTETAEQALEAGARFLVSPFQVPEVRPVADAADRLFVEGGHTPTELRASAERGVAKLFPAHVGGIAYLTSLLAVLPGARIMATGGVTVANAGDWLAAGAFTASIGSDLYRGGDIRGNVARLTRSLTSGDRGTPSGNRPDR
ncbi:bifunctional 4-hydroxy-2-oxoglutarate aldolase/2-dehydro-3-deoxy-phosphogluconate aldolase [Streptomyces sp. NBC_00178]|uniref:bifunctional 4-hydroxy-2-oxoglutarate aldolase/2-dehydro-3-deoxy-phosphogluconate aldolase n=1 Tax=Streptomyces sp. NBC_00178 TaxID=2975672 RepID=UPI002E2DDD36|nr:bifunctional 4-hydroxy-2-oxoglutarate aldolase/2-dehydro-3-deoxy-phosphogluconate aldolase [Streptomyces sp. NBC_00178]